jgi:hypothetical protein
MDNCLALIIIGLFLLIFSAVVSAFAGILGLPLAIIVTWLIFFR